MLFWEHFDGLKSSGFASGSLNLAQLQGILYHSESVLMIENRLALPPADLNFKVGVYVRSRVQKYLGFDP